MHLCHFFSTFGAGGAQIRTARIINALGPSFRHTIVAADERYEAAAYVDAGARVDYVHPPSGKGRYTWALRLRRMFAELSPDLLVTYNWGSMDAVMAACFGRICPVVHTEDGFGADEATGPKRRRVLVRRLVLPRVRAVVVPSRTLAETARTMYGVRSERVVYIPNGVDTRRLDRGPVLGFRRLHGIPPDAIVFGTVGRLRPEKTLGVLVRAFARARIRDSWVVIVGDGECRSEWEALALRLGVADRVLFVGHAQDPAPYYAGFDVFVMSSSTEQMPMALLEAMAAGLPAVCTTVGDTCELLGCRDSPVVTAPGDIEAYARALVELATRPELRRALGDANRRRCEEKYGTDRMVEQYLALYLRVAGDGARS